MRNILKAADTAAVFVTHDREEALSLADRVAVMRDGRIEQIGAPDDIYYRPQTRFIGTFVGDANILPGTRSLGGADTELGYVVVVNAPRVEDGDAFDILLRPEQIALKPATPDDATSAKVISSEYYGHDQVVRVRLPSRGRGRGSVAHRGGLAPRRSRHGRRVGRRHRPAALAPAAPLTAPALPC